MVEPVQRRCPACGHEERTVFERCSACGASFFARPPSRRRRLAVRAAALALALAVAVGVLAARDAQRDRQAREARDIAAAVERRKAELRRLQAPRHGAAGRLRPASEASRAERLAARAALVRAVEAAITRDARLRAARGELRGRFERTECGPVERRPDAVPDHRRPGRRVGRYDCVAVEEPVIATGGRRVAAYGVPFVAAVHFDRFTFVWCRNTPPQSERGVAVHVRLERACLAARGRALGTGYVDDRAPGRDG